MLPVQVGEHAEAEIRSELEEINAQLQALDAQLGSQPPAAGTTNPTDSIVPSCVTRTPARVLCIKIFFCGGAGDRRRRGRKRASQEGVGAAGADAGAAADPDRRAKKRR